MENLPVWYIASWVVVGILLLMSQLGLVMVIVKKQSLLKSAKSSLEKDNIQKASRKLLVSLALIEALVLSAVVYLIVWLGNHS